MNDFLATSEQRTLFCVDALCGFDVSMFSPYDEQVRFQLFFSLATQH